MNTYNKTKSFYENKKLSCTTYSPDMIGKCRNCKEYHQEDNTKAKTWKDDFVKEFCIEENDKWKGELCFKADFGPTAMIYFISRLLKKQTKEIIKCIPKKRIYTNSHHNVYEEVAIQREILNWNEAIDQMRASIKNYKKGL
jgi:hypothetical protein